MMRIVVLLALAGMLSACQTTAEKEAGSVSKAECRQQAAAYVRANAASIPNEERQLEQYNQYRLCLAHNAN